MFSRKTLIFFALGLVGIGLLYDTQWFRKRAADESKNNNPWLSIRLGDAADAPITNTTQRETAYTTTNSAGRSNNSFSTKDGTATRNKLPVIDIISIGSLKRPDYQAAQRATFGQHPSVRRFLAITENDDFDPDCTTRLQWRDVANISGFCGGRRRDIQHKHRLLYELRVKFAKPEWLQRTKTDPVAWLCAQKRPMVGFNQALKGPLPDFLIVMDDDTYYNMEEVAKGLTGLQKTQDDSSMVLAGCAIRSRLQHFKWSFPFGGWGTIFSRGALEAILQPLQCSTNTTTSVWSVKFCPKLWKDRIGEYQVFQDGMSLADVMYKYVMGEPYVDHASWSLGFCLHSDWVWGYMVNYYNVSVAMGRRSKDLIVDRLGAYNGSEINPPYSDALLKLRRQCDFDSDQHCTKEAHMCHYVTPQHMHYLSSSSSQQQKHDDDNR